MFNFFDPTDDELLVLGFIGLGLAILLSILSIVTWRMSVRLEKRTQQLIEKTREELAKALPQPELDPSNPPTVPVLVIHHKHNPNRLSL